MSKGTAHRTIRVEEDLWAAAMEKATERGENLSLVLRGHLESYAYGHQYSPAEKERGIVTMTREEFDETLKAARTEGREKGTK